MKYVFGAILLVLMNMQQCLPLSVTSSIQFRAISEYGKNYAIYEAKKFENLDELLASHDFALAFAVDLSVLCISFRVMKDGLPSWETRSGALIFSSVVSLFGLLGLYLSRSLYYEYLNLQKSTELSITLDEKGVSLLKQNTFLEWEQINSISLFEVVIRNGSAANRSSKYKNMFLKIGYGDSQIATTQEVYIFPHEFKTAVHYFSGGRLQPIFNIRTNLA